MGIAGTHRTRIEEEFPFGKDNPDGTLIICLSSEHRKNVIEAFQLNAQYILPGRDLRGKFYSKIIVFTPQSNDPDVEMFVQWVQSQVRNRTKINAEVIYV